MELVYKKFSFSSLIFQKIMIMIKKFGPSKVGGLASFADKE